MTRKDYILIADGIIEAYKDYIRHNPYEETHSELLWGVISELSYSFKRDNNRFDRDKFNIYIEKGIV